MKTLSKPKRRIQFAPIERSDIHDIPSCLEMDQSQIDSTWYSQSELEYFKNVGRFISRVYRCWSSSSEDINKLASLASSSSPKLRNQLYRKFLADHYPGAASMMTDDEVNYAAKLEVTDGSLDYCIRGLEHRINIDRQTNKIKVIKLTLLRNVPNSEQNNSSLLMYDDFASMKCNAWAAKIALATAAVDAAYVSTSSFWDHQEHGCDDSSLDSRTYDADFELMISGWIDSPLHEFEHNFLTSMKGKRRLCPGDTHPANVTFVENSVKRSRNEQALDNREGSSILFHSDISSINPINFNLASSMLFDALNLQQDNREPTSDLY